MEKIAMKKNLCILFVLLFSPFQSCFFIKNRDVAQESFLADNWNMNIKTWQECIITYRAGQSYLVQINSRRDSLWTFVVIPGDSTCFKRAGCNVYYSARTMLNDSLWSSHFMVNDLIEKTRFVEYNNIESINGKEDCVIIKLFNQDNLLLKTDNIVDEEEWRFIGNGWYENIRKATER